MMYLPDDLTEQELSDTRDAMRDAADQDGFTDPQSWDDNGVYLA